MKCAICDRSDGPFALQRGDKAACLTCITINDPCEVLKKLDEESTREVEEMARSFYAIWNVFDFAAHVAKMKTAHPDWSDRQLANRLYWQAGARKKLTEEIDRFRRQVIDFCMDSDQVLIERCPEAMGLDVTATMAAAGGKLQWPPETRAVQIALAGWRK